MKILDTKIFRLSAESVIRLGTQKCAERAVEAVDAVHAVRIFLGNLVRVDFKGVGPG